MRLRKRYLNALLKGNGQLAARLVKRALDDGWNTAQLYQDLMTPAQIELGRLWKEGKLTVAQEHLGTQITLSQMARLRHQMHPRPTLNLKVVVATTEEEVHSLGAQMVSDLFFEDGWQVDFLGSGTPVGDLVRFIQVREPHLVALSVTWEKHLARLEQTLKQLQRLRLPLKILVGGAAIQRQRTHGRELGVDFVASDALEGVQAARRLLITSPREINPLDDYLKHIGQRIRELRSSHHWSQQELAQKSGLDRAYISVVEHGKQNVTLAALMKLSNALEVPLDQLLVGKTRDSS